MENIAKIGQDAAERIPQMAQTATDSLGKALQNMADNLGPIMDRLAGTQSNVKLSFDDLTFDSGNTRAKISGSINLEVSYINQQQGSTAPQTSEYTQVNRTEVTNVV